jgi:tRNA C32,U32 (ribose-2'-O)-methylase TrmJ
MSAKQLKLCDRFVYIPQHGPGTASLNVTVAASIVLHHFAVWAGLAERERRQHKFVVAERPERNVARGALMATVPGRGFHESLSPTLSRRFMFRAVFAWLPGFAPSWQLRVISNSY